MKCAREITMVVLTSFFVSILPSYAGSFPISQDDDPDTAPIPANNNPSLGFVPANNTPDQGPVSADNTPDRGPVPANNPPETRLRHPTSEAAVSAVTCPAAGYDLDRYRQQLATSFKESHGTQVVTSSIKACFVDKKQPVPACMEDITTALGVPGKMAPEISALGNGLKLPDIFYNKDGKLEVPSDIEAQAKKNNWKIISFKTRGEGGFDESSDNLQLVEIPGSSLKPPQKADWFIQWALNPRGQDRNNPQTTSHTPTHGSFAAIAMMPHADGVTTTPFYYLNNQGDAQLHQRNGMKECVSCHMNGLREISPRGYYRMQDENRLPQADRELTHSMNAAMQIYARNGHLDFGYNDRVNESQRYDPQKIAPAFGDTGDKSYFQRIKESVLGSNETRSKSFILGDGTHLGCSFRQRTLNFEDALGRPHNDRSFSMSNNPSVSWSRVSSAMTSCVNCHDGKKRAILNNLNTNHGALVTKILTDESMPASHQYYLNADERIALINCLEAEGETIQKKWLESIISSPKCRADDHQCPGEDDATAQMIRRLGAVMPIN